MTAILLVLAGAAIVRIVQAGAGSIPPLRAGGEIGLAVAAVGIGAAAASIAAAAGRWGRALVVLALIATGAGLLAPLHRVTHPPASLLETRMSLSAREALSSPAPRSGRFRLQVRDAGPEVEGTVRFVLRVAAGEREAVLTEASTARALDVTLARGQSARLFLEGSVGSIRVSLDRPVPPAGLIRLLALTAALMAVVVDVAGARPRRRGALAAVAGASATFLALLARMPSPSGTEVVGAAGISVLGGALLATVAVVAAAVVRRAGGRGRTARARRERAARDAGSEVHG